VYLIDVLLENDNTTCFGQRWPSSGFIRKIICCKNAYIKYADAYRCWDLINEDIELNIAYSLIVEPSGYGVGPWAVWSKFWDCCIVGQYPSFVPVVDVTAG